MPAPIVLQDMSGLAEGITQAGSALGQGLGKYIEKKRTQEYDTTLGKILDELPENATDQDYFNSYQKAMNKGIPIDYVNKMMPMIKQKIASKKADQGVKRNTELSEDINKQLKAAGYDDATADLWSGLARNSTVGSQTEIVKAVTDMLKRKPIGKGVKSKKPKEITPGYKHEGVPSDEMFFPEVDPFEGMTPVESYKTSQSLRDENNPIFKDHVEKIKAKSGELEDIKLLDKINQRNRLPDGFDWKSALIDPDTGGLRPWGQILNLPNADMEQYVKTLMGFTKRAKDSFGARVTNFDLETILKTFPNLLNSKEGRERIIKQMQLTEEIDLVIRKGMRDTYRHYGLGKITQEQADEISTSNVQDEVDRLHAQYQTIGEELEQMSGGGSTGDKQKGAGSPVEEEMKRRGLL